jgi:hypothetical protein
VIARRQTGCPSTHTPPLGECGQGEFWNVDEAPPSQALIKPIPLRRSNDRALIQTRISGGEKASSRPGDQDPREVVGQLLHDERHSFMADDTDLECVREQSSPQKQGLEWRSTAGVAGDRPPTRAQADETHGIADGRIRGQKDGASRWVVG